MLGRAQYEKTGNNKIDAFYEDLSSASEKSTSHAVGDALALTAIPYNDSLSYGMLAFNSDRSTEEDPIIKISCNYGGQQRYYDVHVNEVDPRNASMSNGFIDLDDSSNYNVKVDWIKMLKEMARDTLEGNYDRTNIWYSLR
jgi:hypothetical protein